MLGHICQTQEHVSRRLSFFHVTPVEGRLNVQNSRSVIIKPSDQPDTRPLPKRHVNHLYIYVEMYSVNKYLRVPCTL